MVRTPQQERSKHVVACLIEAAAERFGVDGYDGASVRAIADTAGVPTGALYQYFAGKQGLLDALTAIYELEVDGLFAAPKGPDPERPLSDHDLLVAVVSSITSRLLQLAAERPGFRAMFSGPASQDPLAVAGVRLRERFASGVRAALSTVSDDESEAAADVVTQIARGLVGRIVSADGVIDERLAPHLDVALVAYVAEVKRRSMSTSVDPEVS